MGTDAFMRAHAEKAVKENGTEPLACVLAGMPDKQMVILIATKSIATKACFPEWGLDIDLSKDTCSWADQAGLWMLGRVARPRTSTSVWTKDVSSPTGV